MTFADTVDLVVSGALWLRSPRLHESDALDVVHRTYRTMTLRATLEGRRAIMVEMDPEIAQTAIRRCEEIDA